MTIKQQGGVFGRNPTFNTVDVESSLNVDGQLTTDGLLSSKSGGSSGQFIGYSSVLGVSNNNNGQISFGNNTSFQGIISYEGATSGNFYFDNTWNNAGAAVVFRNRTAATAEELGRFNSNGLVLPNGKGIDFSATSGTGTSELFDDYEEGTFNCAYSTTGTAFDSITMDATRTKGYYVKIGRAVHVQCTLRSDAVTVGSASGDLIITGLPFSAPANSSGTGDAYASFAVSLTGGFASDNPFVLATRPGHPHLLVRKRTSVTGNDVAMVPSDLATGANANSITFSGTYYV